MEILTLYQTVKSYFRSRIEKYIMKILRYSAFFILIYLLSSCTEKKVLREDPDIIPRPAAFEWTKGNFTINSKTEILVNTSNQDVRKIAVSFGSKIAAFTGADSDVSEMKSDQRDNSIYLRLDHTLLGTVRDEGYTLSVRPSGIEISAARPAGLFYGIQTLYQLLPPDIFARKGKSSDEEIKLSVPCIEITDMPSFAWRGMHLDVSRHFFSKEFVKKYIDLIAMHKMNVFHWHLTDDNGWRIQIDKYPKLTEIGAWRADRTGIPWNERQPQQAGEAATYGGFYTKEDIREIVEYARQRFITVVPEIEMPGHTSEVFAAYPEYSCTGKKTTVQTGSYWPNSNIFCAGKENTFEFLEDVLDEVIELFPSEYVHIGGDEADKTAWKTCPSCQARIRNEKLAGVEELQSYFVKRMEKYLAGKGKKMIGWDEILEGGLAPEATVMSWRGVEGGIEAARLGHKVVMCPTSHCYFDYYQADPDFQPPAIGGLTTLKKVYSYRPVPEELKGESRKLIMGAQGNLWTEYVPTPSHAEYMVLPRMTALAEVLWSPEEKLDWDDFRNRLKKQFARFDKFGANFSPGSGKVEAFALYNTNQKPFSIRLDTEVPDAVIYYTLNGNPPDKKSFIYKGPISVDRDLDLKAIAYHGAKKLEKPAEYTISFHKGILKEITYQDDYSERYPGSGPGTLNDGIRASLDFNDGYWQGFHGKNARVVIDLGEGASFNAVSATFLNDQQKWIFLPDSVHYYLSVDGKNFQKLVSVKNENDVTALAAFKHDFTVSLKKPLRVRYIRMEAVSKGVCPAWHPGKGQKSWLFIDEIIVK
jgi:hexosaminidase